MIKKLVRNNLGTPIFVCGHAKSGTTLLAALLDGHSQILAFPEETFFLNHVRSNPNLSLSERIEWLLTQVRHKQPSEASKDQYDGWTYDYFRDLDWLENYLHKTLANGQKSDKDVLEALLASYAEETQQLGKSYWLEKTHGNEMALDLLQKWYPSLRAIYIVRDPRDVLVSWSRRMRASEKSGAIENFLYRWGMSTWAWREYTARNQGLTIRYEELLRFPQATIKHVCDYLELDYERSLETPTKNGRLWAGNSMHGEAFSGISTSPIGRWREKMSDKELELIEGFLGKTMLSYGYQLSQPLPSFSRMSARWLRLNGKRRQLIAMLVRLHWPFLLPARLQ